MRCFGLVVMLAFATAGCAKPELDDCRKACWNHNKIMFWAKVDKDAEGLSPEDAAKLRAEREVEFRKIQTREEDPGLLNCITNCQHNARPDQVKCLQKATTPDEATSCIK